MWLLLQLLLAAHVVPELAEELCNLQLRFAASKNEALMPEPIESPWVMPGIHFQHCVPDKSGFHSTKVVLQEKDLGLPPKLPVCGAGETLIGHFAEESYEFKCCSGQCGGCAKNHGGECVQCASGFVKQMIPILNITKCFMCDDVPGWTDAAGYKCADYAAMKWCNGSWPNISKDQAFQGIRPSEACCACGGGSVFPSPVTIPLASQMLYNGQVVNASPDVLAEDLEVGQCNLASAGLTLPLGIPESDLRCAMNHRSWVAFGLCFQMVSTCFMPFANVFNVQQFVMQFGHVTSPESTESSMFDLLFQLS